MNKPEIVLGNIIENDAERDAIHVAVAPVVAACKLAPGQDVGLTDPVVNPNWVGISEEPIGIVDPFLKSLVFEGQKFWLMLYPNTITPLRHVWTHPVIDGHYLSSKEQSEKWLRDFSERAGEDYDFIMEKAEEFIDTGEVWVQQGSERVRGTFYELSDRGREFWQHFQNVTGIEVSLEFEYYETPFNCSC